MRSLTLVLALMLSGATCMVPPVTSALGRAHVMSTRGHVYAMAKKPMVDEMPFANSLASLLSAAVVVASSITPLALPAPALQRRTPPRASPRTLPCTGDVD